MCSGGSDQKRDTLLDWRTVQSKVAWNIVLLLGSGFALSAGAKVYPCHPLSLSIMYIHIQ